MIELPSQYYYNFLLIAFKAVKNIGYFVQMLPNGRFYTNKNAVGHRQQGALHLL